MLNQRTYERSYALLPSPHIHSLHMPTRAHKLFIFVLLIFFTFANWRNKQNGVFLQNSACKHIHIFIDLMENARMRVGGKEQKRTNKKSNILIKRKTEKESTAKRMMLQLCWVPFIKCIHIYALIFSYCKRNEQMKKAHINRSKL